MNKHINLINLQDRDLKVKYFRYPAGELGVRLTKEYIEVLQDASPVAIGSGIRPRPEIEVRTRLKTNDDIIYTYLVIDAIKNVTGCDIFLYIPYLPYGRQDKIHTPGDSCSIKLLADLFERNVKYITTYDLHSYKINEYFKTTKIAECSFLNYLLNSNLSIDKKDIIVLPDKGSCEKYRKWPASSYSATPFILECSKSRDKITGKLSNPIINNPEVITYNLDSNLYIVDDICDGGYTFIQLIMEIRKLTQQKINLIVTHSMFSNEENLSKLAFLCNKIYTTNSWLEKDKHPWVNNYPNIEILDVFQ